jgi:flagellar protein FlaF
MHPHRIKAYELIERATLPGVELEATVLVRVATRLKECQDRWDDADHQARLREALEYSQKVWTFFQSELSRPDHPLPQALRQDLVNLSVFIDRRIFEVMAYPAPEKLTAIININRDIAAGLRGSGRDEA